MTVGIKKCIYNKFLHIQIHVPSPMCPCKSLLCDIILNYSSKCLSSLSYFRNIFFSIMLGANHGKTFVYYKIIIAIFLMFTSNYYIMFLRYVALSCNFIIIFIYVSPMCHLCTLMLLFAYKNYFIFVIY